MNLFHELGKAAEAGMPFLLIGGHAVIAHGYPRVTFDVDILVPDTHVVVWKEWFEQRGYRCFHDTHAFMQFVGSGAGALPADVMKVNADVFPKIAVGTIRRMIEGVEIPIAAPERIIALKVHALRNRPLERMNKDWGDILELIRICQIDVRDPEFRAMVIKQGGPTVYEKLLADTQPST